MKAMEHQKPASTESLALTPTASRWARSKLFVHLFSASLVFGTASSQATGISVDFVNDQPGSYVVESDGSATLQVRRTGDIDRTVRVDYRTADGTAHAGIDYVATSGTLIFAPGEAIANLQVTI